MISGNWFFESWSDLLRVLLVGTAAYVALVAMVRISGKRTLAKLNAFDLIVTIALGSTLATVLLSSTVSLVEGLTALALLIGLQYLVARTARRFPGFEKMVKAEPRLLAHRGEFIEASLTDERITRSEVLAAVRAHGKAELHDVAAVVLETDGSLSVITSAERTTAIDPVRRPGDAFD